MREVGDDWVELRSCVWLHEAHLLQSVLAAAGIETQVPDEQTLGVQPFLSPMLGGVRVLVRETDLERAREVLQNAALPPDEVAPGDAG